MLQWVLDLRPWDDMPRPAVVLVLLRDRNDGEGHGMRKARVFGQVLGVQGMVIEDVTVQVDPDGDEDVLVVSARPDAGASRRCAQCRLRCPGHDAGVGYGGGGRWTPAPFGRSCSRRRRGCGARSTVCWWRTCRGRGRARSARTCWRTHCAWLVLGMDTRQASIGYVAGWAT